MDGGPAGAGSEVLATLVLGSRLGDELIKRRRSSRLSNWVFTGTCLTRSVTTSQGSQGEYSRLRSLLGIVNIDREPVSVDGRGLLMTSSESIGRRRRERRMLGGRFVTLGRRVAPAEACGRRLGRGRDLKARSIDLLLLLLLLLLELELLLLLQLLKLLELLELLQLLKLLLLLLEGRILGELGLIDVLAGGALVDQVGRLTSGGVNEGVDAGLDARNRTALVLAIQGELLLLNLRVDSESLELLSGGLDVAELLLQALLLLSKIRVGSNQLSVHRRVHLLLHLGVELQLGRSKNLVSGILLAHVHQRVERGLLTTAAVSGQSSLGSVVSIVGRSVGVDIDLGELLLGLLSHGGLRREGRSGGGLGSGPQTSQKVRAAGAGSGSAIILISRGLDGIEGERLDVLATATRRQT